MSSLAITKLKSPVTLTTDSCEDGNGEGGEEDSSMIMEARNFEAHIFSEMEVIAVCTSLPRRAVAFRQGEGFGRKSCLPRRKEVGEFGVSPCCKMKELFSKGCSVALSSA